MSGEVDLSSSRDLEPVPDHLLEEGDVVRVAGALLDELGVVTSGPPGARVELPWTGLTVRAESGPVVEVLEDVDELLGVDVEGQYHCYRRTAREVVVQDVDGEAEVRFDLQEDELQRWFEHVTEARGWHEHRRVYDSRGWFG